MNYINGYSNLTKEWMELLTYLGKRIKLTFFRRNDDLRFDKGVRSLFDTDFIVEGTLELCPRTSAAGINRFDNGELDFCFLRSMKHEPQIGSSSRFDGKISGSYEIEVLE